MSLIQLSPSNGDLLLINSGSFSTGKVIRTRNELVFYTDQYGNSTGYRWLGNLPHVINGNSPQTDGGISSTSWESYITSNLYDKLKSENITLSGTAHLPTVEVAYGLKKGSLKVWSAGLVSSSSQYWLYTDGTVWSGVGVLGTEPDVPFTQIHLQRDIIKYNYIVQTDGETLINIPYDFTSIDVFINGVLQNSNSGSYKIIQSTIQFSDVLNKGDNIQFYLSNVPISSVRFALSSDLTNYVLKSDLSNTSGANNVGFYPGGTVQDAIVYTTPEMFGAIGDGITDDTNALQNAINFSKNKTLLFSNGKKYRTKNLIVPHPMTFKGLGRRQDGAIIPYGNVSSESFIHTGTLILLTTSSTVTFYDLTVDARGITLSFVDGQRLTGVGAADNNSGVYQSGLQMYNCNVSGFSGNNLYGGGSKSFGILKDCQFESSGKSCVRIDGVDWRISHCAIGRSLESYGIEILNENNFVSNCDSYFNKLSGIFYQQPTGMAFIKLIGNTINSNGQHGISCSLPYAQPAGTVITNNIFWNNSTELTGTYHNIDLNYGRGHIVENNVHKAYQATAGSDSARCGYCINLRNGATLSGFINDAIDPLYSYVIDKINVNSQNFANQNEISIGTGLSLTKTVSSDTSIGIKLNINSESYDRVQINPGKILLGNGSAEPTHGIQQLAAYPGITMGVLGLGVVGNYSSSVFRIGTHRIWSGGDNTLRTKYGADPTSATDGNILSVKVSVPSTATSTGIVGQWAADDTYLYICTAANTWKRVSINTW
ncbi:putative structural protein [Klebsiella phage K64-1]|uniref:Depolymerase, capsule K30/K69-specific n=1 Tax=Klebsiella phage K64-1 TaxID=1439894 RepID=DPO26_BPK64|nr:tail protein [Klebsiella phage K64-1]A0A0A8J9B0.1 RecName: Full=Depolymerase, capsule K30/K69-specific; AltName: Full=Probable tail spike protein [Klebsiella phage K64-1]BAQ02843.1 putative structural protein [Klebsiella phage K64-1]BAW85699.1 pectate lyase [Klebsiella phage K64-1]